MAPAESALRVELVFSPAPRQVRTAQCTLPAGSTLADAVEVTGWVAEYGLSVQTMRCGVWGRVQPMDTPLRDGDRVEIYRPLTVDPKEARRLRYKKQRRV